MNTKLQFLLQKPSGATPTPGPATNVNLHRRLSALIPRLAAGLPWLLLGGFLFLALILFGDRLLPAREVFVATVVALAPAAPSPNAAAAAELLPASPITPVAALPLADPNAPALFQASGWIEPSPFPLRVTALTNGIIAEVHVLEGQAVSSGQLLATLIDEDARLETSAARAGLAGAEATFQAARHESAMASARLVTLEREIAAANARCDELRDEADRLALLDNGAASERDITQSRLQYRTQLALVETLVASRTEFEAELALRQSQAESARLGVEQARVALAQAELALARTRISSPVNGVLQRLLAAPGQKKGVEMDDPESATVAILFQPDRLQARIDIPLEEAARVAVGQPVRILTNFLPGQIFSGTVTRIEGQADLQRNTLQVKVALARPDPRLRPEMLCRAEFLPASPDALLSPHPSAILDTPSSLPLRSSSLRIFAPERALFSRQDNRAEVWLLEPAGSRVARRDITLGDLRNEGHILVLDGLRPNDRVVFDPPAHLRPGQRVSPRPFQP